MKLRISLVIAIANRISCLVVSRPQLIHHKYSGSILFRFKSFLSCSEQKNDVERKYLGEDVHDQNYNLGPVRRLKVRQHVNPLASSYQIPILLENDWMEKSFETPSLPLYIDVGCSKGTWALNLAAKNSQVNVLGLEIRRPVVEECLRRKEKSGLKNIHYMYANANVNLNSILASIHKTTNIQVITIQFPDPHFKKSHHKRRVVNTQFINEIANNMLPGKHVFLQSDVLDITLDMISHFTSSPHFVPAAGYNLDTLTSNPKLTEIQTEREIATIAKGMPVYRMKFERVMT